MSVFHAEGQQRRQAYEKHHDGQGVFVLDEFAHASSLAADSVWTGRTAKFVNAASAVVAQACRIHAASSLRVVAEVMTVLETAEVNGTCVCAYATRSVGTYGVCSSP